MNPTSTRKPLISAVTWTVLPLFLGSAFLLLAIIAPRPVAPDRAPALRLDRGLVARAEEALRQRSRSRDSSLLVAEAEALYRQLGRAELTVDEHPYVTRRRSDRLATLAKEIVQESGEATLTTMRARAVVGMEEAIEGKGDVSSRNAHLGSFPRIMQRYGLARDGLLVAPSFVVSAFYSARWNAAHGLDADFGLEVIEKQAYYGWLALHAADAPLPLRFEALAAFARAGGRNSLEARAYLLYKAGRLEDSAKAYAESYAALPSLRVRNHGFFVLGEATGDVE